MARISRISLLSFLAMACAPGGSKLNAAGGESRLVAAYFHLSGDANDSDLQRVVSIANRLIAMLTRLIRR